MSLSSMIYSMFFLLPFSEDGAVLLPDQDASPEIIDSGPMCFADLFQKKYLACFNPK